ncbi:MAG: glycosyltransferase family 2 protein [Dehalococcoidia bacterium]
MSATLAATVLIPTYRNGRTLLASVPSALAQTVEDLEVLVVGDGVLDETREIVHELQAADPRVRFFDLPKGAGRGERLRHRVLAEARGEIVCYLWDDDLWLPDHVATMRAALQKADVVAGPQVIVQPDGSLRIRSYDLTRATDRDLLTHPKSVVPSVPTTFAHTLTFYRRLPHGWRPAPAGYPSDKFMWKQLFSVLGMRGWIDAADRPDLPSPRAARLVGGATVCRTCRLARDDCLSRWPD